MASKTETESVPPSYHESTRPDMTITPSSGVLKFQVDKTTSLGLIMPENQKLNIHQISPDDNSVIGPAYTTSEMSWVEIMTAMPPAFELTSIYPGRPYGLVGRMYPRGLQGFTGLTIDIDVQNPEPPRSTRSAPEPFNGTPSSAPGSTKWTITHKPLSRKFKVLNSTNVSNSNQKGQPQFVWKGSRTSSQVAPSPGQSQESSKKDKMGKGSFKLVSLGPLSSPSNTAANTSGTTSNPKSRSSSASSSSSSAPTSRSSASTSPVLAIWSQSHGSMALGELTIFEHALEHISVEAIIMTCMTCVFAERASGMNWVAGLGKG